MRRRFCDEVCFRRKIHTWNVGTVSRAEFESMVSAALSRNVTPMTDAEIDLLFRAFDTNR